MRAQLVRARTQFAVLEEQLVAYNDEADETRIRALVSDAPNAAHDHTDAQRHAEAAARTRAALARTIHDLELSQDDLLDRLVSTPS